MIIWWLFDDYLIDYLIWLFDWLFDMIIWLIIWSLFDWLFDHYLSIIWFQIITNKVYIIGWLFDLFNDYSTCFLFNYSWLFVIIVSIIHDYLKIFDNYSLKLFVIIWWLFGLNYLMIIWSYLMIIWKWLFVIICFYSMIIRSELFMIIVIIRWLFGLSYSWLFVIIWYPGKQLVGRPASLSMALLHIFGMASCCSLRGAAGATHPHCQLLASVQIQHQHWLALRSSIFS